MNSVQKIEIDWLAQTVFIQNNTILPPVVVFKIEVGGFIFYGSNMKHLAKFMTPVLLAIAGLADAAGNAIALDTLTAIWESSDPAVAEVVVGADGTVSVNPTGLAGTVQVTCRVDSDPNTPEFAVGSIDITFPPGEATVIALKVVEPIAA